MRSAPKTRLPWHRLLLSLFGIVLLAAHWRWAVHHLYSLPEYAMAAFASVTVAFMGAVAAVVIFMVTGNRVNGTVSDLAVGLLGRTESEEEK
ncbi:MAG: hypothetical protein ACFUZC_16650 [Chthoniobacteraceae bacterium]